MWPRSQLGWIFWGDPFNCVLKSVFYSSGVPFSLFQAFDNMTSIYLDPLLHIKIKLNKKCNLFWVLSAFGGFPDRYWKGLNRWLKYIKSRNPGSVWTWRRSGDNGQFSPHPNNSFVPLLVIWSSFASIFCYLWLEKEMTILPFPEYMKMWFEEWSFGVLGNLGFLLFKEEDPYNWRFGVTILMGGWDFVYMCQQWWGWQNSILSWSSTLGSYLVILALCCLNSLTFCKLLSIILECVCK